MSGSIVSKKSVSLPVAKSPKKAIAKKVSKSPTSSIATGSETGRRAGRPKAQRDIDGNIIKKCSYSYINRKPAPTKVRKQVPEGELLRAVALMGSLAAGEFEIDSVIQGDAGDIVVTTAEKVASLEKLVNWMEELKSQPKQRFNTLQNKIKVLKEQQEDILATENETVRLTTLQTEIASMEQELNTMKTH